MTDSDTDYKLGELKSSVPHADLEMLLEVLISCNGNLVMAKELLGIPSGVEMSLDPPASLQQSKLQHQVTLKRFFQSSSPDNAFDIKRQRLQEKGKTIHLYDPADVEKLLPCTMHLNVFPKALADDVLKFLIKDSEKWPQNRSFYLFGKLVSSPHTTGFYTDNDDIYENKRATYNGEQVKNPFLFNADMREAKLIVQDVVNREIHKRGLMPFQHPGKWQTDVALCNKYNGPKESVGFHSDQLTHIGPHCVIASISLGVTREFRLKSRTNKDKSPFSVHLPHNSLIIMHAGCQEEYKHSLIPSFSQALDLHPIAGAIRINLTYRMYLESFNKDKMPKCKCGIPMILRVSNNSSTKYEDSPVSTSNPHVYIWLCGSSYSNEKGCGYSFSPTFPVNKSTNFEYNPE